MTPGNKNIVLIVGKPTTGKTTSLLGLANQSKIAYLNADLKEIPFKHKFKELNLVDPKKVIKAIKEIESSNAVDSAVLDTVSKLMEQFEVQYVHTHKNGKGILDTMGGWGEYAKFYGSFMQAIKGGSKSYAVMGHAADTLNEKEMIVETKVPVKGAVGKVGIEADFTTIIASKKISLAVLEEHSNSMLNITDRDRDSGFKYVFQTRIDNATIGEQIRSAIGLWEDDEKYIDNNIDFVFKRLQDYYS